MFGAGGRRDRGGDALVGEAPAQEGLGPGREAGGGQLGWERPPEQPALAERAHDEDTEAKVRGEWQDPRLGIAFARVERDLDGVDPAGAHDLLEFGEGCRLVGRRPEVSDVADATFALHPVEMPPPRDQVVDLEQVDPAAEPAELAREVAAALLDGARPDLGRDERLAPVLAERVRQDRLGAPVHR